MGLVRVEEPSIADRERPQGASSFRKDQQLSWLVLKPSAKKCGEKDEVTGTEDTIFPMLLS